MAFYVDVSQIKRYTDCIEYGIPWDKSSEPDQREIREYKEQVNIFNKKISDKGIKDQRPYIEDDIDYTRPYQASYKKMLWETKPPFISANHISGNLYITHPVFIQKKVTLGSKLEVAAAYDILKNNTNRLIGEFKSKYKKEFNIMVSSECNINLYNGQKIRFEPIDLIEDKTYLDKALEIAWKVRKNI